MTISKTFLHIRAVTILYFATLATITLHAQSHEEDKYFSNEQEAYYDSLPHPSLEPASREEILSFRLPHITIRELRAFTPFKNIAHMSPEQQQGFEALYNREGSFPEEGTSGVSQPFIIKKRGLNGKQAFLYMDNMLDEAWAGVWLALYEEESGQWHKYYTGLAQGQPLFLKWNSRLPLFKDSITLQVEAAFLRETYSEQYFAIDHELVKDGAVVEIDLAAITADTDGDGLTDVVEAKMGLNPTLKDTDRDGMTDKLDPNPRFSQLRTELSSLYEAVLSDTLPAAYEGFRKVPFASKQGAVSALPQRPVGTKLIVSDSRDIQGITLADERVIILTSKEYEQHKANYPSTFSQYYLSPLFRIDGMPNTYRFSVSYGPGGTEYLVRKGRGGWEYKMLSTWIE